MNNNIETKEFTLHMNGQSVPVTVTLDWNLIRWMAERANRSKTGRCVGGPVTVKVRRGKK